LRSEDEEFILRTTEEIADREGTPAGTGTDSDCAERGVVLGVPAADSVDEVALAMLGALMRLAGTAVSVRIGLPTQARCAAAPGAAPAAILVAAIGPGGLTEARFLCRRLRDQYPEVNIIVGRWGRGKDPGKARLLLLPAGADRVTATLRESRVHLARVIQPLIPTPEVGPQAV
jgi:hypothetical protein